MSECMPHKLHQLLRSEVAITLHVYKHVQTYYTRIRVCTKCIKNSYSEFMNSLIKLPHI